MDINRELRIYAGEWEHFAPTEYLLPRLEKTIALDEVPFIEKRKNNPLWSQKQLLRHIRKLGHWEYSFQFGHGLTTALHGSFNERTIDFHRFRSRLISETVIDLLGSAAEEATVLDLACHCGFFSMDMADRGVAKVDGVDIRVRNLAQARFLGDYYGFDNISYERRDVYSLARQTPQYDVVLCLGLLYHVTRPIELLELCQRAARKLVVIETLCHKQPFPGYRLVTGKNTQVAIEGIRTLELQPTYRGLLATFGELGYDNVLEVTGVSERAIDLYSDAVRRCFIWRAPESGLAGW